MDQLIPQVSSLKTLKYMFDSLTKIFEEHKLEYDFEKTVKECEDLECRDHTVILYKGIVVMDNSPNNLGLGVTNIL